MILLQTIQNHLIFSFQIFPLLSLPVESSPKKRSKSTKLLKPPCSTFSIFGALCCTSAWKPLIGISPVTDSYLAAILLTSSYILAEQNHWASPFLFKKNMRFLLEIPWDSWFLKLPQFSENPTHIFTQKIPSWLTPSLVQTYHWTLRIPTNILPGKCSRHRCHIMHVVVGTTKKTTFWTKQQQGFTSHWLSTKEFRKKKLQAFKIAFFLHIFCQKNVLHIKENIKKKVEQNLQVILEIPWAFFLLFDVVVFPTFLQGTKVSSFWCKSSALPLTSVLNRRRKKTP